MVIELDKSSYRSNHHTIFMGRDIYIIDALDSDGLANSNELND